VTVDWQGFVAVVLVVGALAYLVRRAYRVWMHSRAGTCGGGCGCGARAPEDVDARTESFTAADKLGLRPPATDH
jgi:hypothetical protein